MAKLTFGQRMRLALGTILGSSKSIATLIPTWQQGQPVWTDVDFGSMVQEGYSRNELIFVCVSKAANTASQVRLQVLNKATEEPIPHHPIMAILERPNPIMSQFDLWASVHIYLKLAGRAYYEKERSSSGQVVRLWPLRPDWVKPIRGSSGSDEPLRAYKFGPPGVEPAILEPRDVLDFRLFHPLDYLKGHAPVVVAARAGDVDNAVTGFLKLFFDKGGTPPGLLKSTQRLTDAQVEIIRQRWGERYGGYEQWMTPAVLDSDAEYQKIGLNFQEMGFDVLDARDEVRICMVMDVPPTVVGAKIGLDRAILANAREFRRMWWEDSLVPQYSMIAAELNADLAPEYGGNITMAWDYSEVPALQEDRSERWKRASDGVMQGWATINEARKEAGLSDIGPMGEVFLRGPMQIAVPKKSLLTGEADRGDELNQPEDEGEKAIPVKPGESWLDKLPAELKADDPGLAPDDGKRRQAERELRKK